MKIISFLLLAFLFLSDVAHAQLFGREATFTKQDTLRGSITPERAWWDLTYYHLQMQVHLDDSTFSGSNTIRYKVDSLTTNRMQVDLQAPMRITKAEQNGKTLNIEQVGSAYFIETQKPNEVGEEHEVVVYFEGKPHKAIRAPWDGGITWTRDQNGNPFIASSNQGIGASIWWPNKDHGYDEPNNGMKLSIRVPDPLMNVSNGRLVEEEKHGDGTTTWHWEVINPINNYGVNINIGDYKHFKEIYDGEKGILDMDFYVLSYNLEKAMTHFADAKRTMQAFEYWFGPYPFYEDSFKLVEAPYLGMEHQSSVTYGNGYQKGYLGRDLSQSGWGLKFDFIIIHETGHEWFANNITYKDVADMWIHESFTNYSESLFLEYHYGKEAADEYVIGTRLAIQNDRPIIGIYNVNYEGSSDMYYKGANMLHTIRQLVNNDEAWRALLRGLNKDFYHQTVSSAEIEAYMTEKTGLNLKPVFDQYLRDYRVPILEYSFKNNQLLYRWGNAVRGFNMPVKVYIDGKETMLEPTTSWRAMNSRGEDLEVDKNFYVGSMNVLGN
ncbi:M1 family metallopeptidase [Balneola vulgaris]|uniref:M1 family metallopeptidase n=1 Tax=Balneola vulgaris TaxID=287535 RepID=UPI000382DC56|nr:M1 family metallopeptidase [Balneola vulgaris]